MKKGIKEVGENLPPPVVGRGGSGMGERQVTSRSTGEARARAAEARTRRDWPSILLMVRSGGGDVIRSIEPEEEEEEEAICMYTSLGKKLD